MLQLPNYSEDSLEVKILRTIANHPQTKYFIVAKFNSLGAIELNKLHEFITRKVINRENNTTFKTSFSDQDTRLILTFYPTNSNLEYKYSLIHTFIEMCNNSAIGVKIDDTQKH
jgi:hypothetical protein